MDIIEVLLPPGRKPEVNHIAGAFALKKQRREPLFRSAEL